MRTAIRTARASAFNFYKSASRVFDVLSTVLDRTEITYAHWAQFMESTFGDDSYGMIRKDGHRKAPFNAFKIYADLPEERTSVSTSGGSLGSFASTSAHKAGLLLWNKDENQEQSVAIELKNLPFFSGAFRVYRIDQQHASYVDGASENLEPVEQQQSVKSSCVSWTGKIPARGVLYITMADQAVASEFDPTAKAVDVAKVVRQYHWYPNRKKASFAHFDRKSWRAFLGMGAEDQADALVGVVAEGLPSVVRVAFTVSGTPQKKDATSLLGLRVDYWVGNAYAKGAFFHNGICDAAGGADFPWGTQHAPDTAVGVDLSGFDLDLGAVAPDGWNNGRAVISFVQRNTGSGSRAEVTVRKK